MRRLEERFEFRTWTPAFKAAKTEGEVGGACQHQRCGIDSRQSSAAAQYRRLELGGAAGDLLYLFVLHESFSTSTSSSARQFATNMAAAEGWGRWGARFDTDVFFPLLQDHRLPPPIPHIHTQPNRTIHYEINRKANHTRK